MISKGCDSTWSRWLALSSSGLVSNRMQSSGVPAPVAAFLDDRRVGAGRLLAKPVTSNKLSSAVTLIKRGKETVSATHDRVLMKRYAVSNPSKKDNTVLYSVHPAEKQKCLSWNTHSTNTIIALEDAPQNKTLRQTWWLVLQVVVWVWTWALPQSAWWSHFCPCCLWWTQTASPCGNWPSCSQTIMKWQYST